MRTTRNKKHGAVMNWFNNAAEFARAADAIPSIYRDCDTSWTGETWGMAVEQAIKGSKKHVKAAESLLATFTAELEVPKTTWVRSVAGAFPSVPDAIVGHPDSMRRKVLAVDPVTPIRIFIDTTSSGGISFERLIQRGITALALVIVLESVRPLEMYVTCTNSAGPTPEDRTQRACNNIVRIPTGPLDMATACNVLTSQGFTRGLGYSYSRFKDHNLGGWEWGFTPHREELRAKWIRRWKKCLGCQPTDLVIPPIYLDDPMLKDPIGFLHRTINEYTNPEAQEAMLMNLPDTDED